jgi:V8-like Glu-specific endopeptidase
MHDQIVEALRAAFPDPGDMSRVVLSADIGVTFDDFRAAVATTYPQAISSLLYNYAYPQGKLVPLLKAARKKNKDNVKLGAVINGLAELEEDFASLRPDLSFGEAEGIVLKGADFENVATWIRDLTAARHRVCRIESDPQFGTGFLVAPDVIITNFHVAEKFWKDPKQAKQVVLRFGYETDTAGKKPSPGVEHKLASTWRGPGKPTAEQAKRPWQVLSSPEGELDFALLRLEKAAGDEKVIGGKRGVFEPISSTISPGDPLLILQHPQAEPLKLAFGAVKKKDPPNRVLYQVNTEPGSSGSPCLNQRLETVALHHWGIDDTKNRGVTFKAIRGYFSDEADTLKVHGLEHLIPPSHD